MFCGQMESLAGFWKVKFWVVSLKKGESPLMIYDMNYVSAIVISYPPDSVPAVTIYGITNKDAEIQRLNHLHQDTVYI